MAASADSGPQTHLPTLSSLRRLDADRVALAVPRRCKAVAVALTLLGAACLYAIVDILTGAAALRYVGHKIGGQGFDAVADQMLRSQTITIAVLLLLGSGLLSLGLAYLAAWLRQPVLVFDLARGRILRRRWGRWRDCGITLTKVKAVRLTGLAAEGDASPRLAQLCLLLHGGASVPLAVWPATPKARQQAGDLGSFLKVPFDTSAL